MTRPTCVSKRSPIWLQRSLVILLLIVIANTIALAQSVTDGTTPAALAPGAPAGSYALSGIDNVNLFGGQLTVTLPLLSVGGRGEVRHSMALPIESRWKNLYFFQNPGGGYFNPFPMHNFDFIFGFKPGYGPGVLVLRGTRTDISPCPAPWFGNTVESQTRLTFVAGNGTEYELRDTIHDGAPLQYGCATPPPNRGTVFVTNDGTATTFISDTLIDEQFVSSRELYGYLMLRDGTRHRIENGLVVWTRDRNGNQITYTYTNDRVTLIKDPLDREITIEYNFNDVAPFGVCDRIKFKGSGGQERIIRVSYSPLSASFGSGHSALTKNQMFPPLSPDWVTETPGMNTPFETNVISSVWLPDGRRYRFLYNGYAEVVRAELPTGGAYEWDIESTPLMHYEDPHPQEILRRVKERRVINGGGVETKTTYSYSLPGFQTGNTIVTVDNFDGSQPGKPLSQEKHYFSGTPIPPSFAGQQFIFSDSPWTHGKEFQTELLGPNGSPLLQRTTQTWRQRASVSWCDGTPCTQATAPIKDPRMVETTTTLVDTNQVSKTTSLNPSDPTGQTVGFDQFNNQTDSWEYDFGGGQPGAFIRRTHFDYVTTGSYVNANVDPASGAHLRSLISQTWTSSNSSGTSKVSLTVFEYDNYSDDARHKPLVLRPGITSHGASYSNSFSVRGNNTGVTSFTTASSQTGPVTQSRQFDIAGNVVATIDGQANVASMTFSDALCNGSTCGGTFNANTYAFVASNTSPVPDPTGEFGSTTGLTTSKVYDFWTGNVTATTNNNNQTTNYEYVDVLDRLTAVIRPSGGGRTDYEYGDTVGNLFVRTLTDLDATRRTESSQHFDALGRVIETRTFENSGQYISVKQIPFVMQQDPDTSGVWLAASQKSNPFRPYLSEQPVWSTTFVDSMSRPMKVRSPDNAIVRSSYSGNTITVTDQANRQRRSVTDALGRLTKVYEDPAGLNYLTDYGYDAVDNLISVSQQDPVTQHTQIRNFAYDSLKRMTSVSNPESGTVNYKYDNNGNILVKTDARNVSTHFKYDGVNRVTRRWYNSSNDTTATVHNSPALPSSVGTTDESKLYYDSSLPAGAPDFDPGHAVGRLVAELYGTGIAGDYYAYDALGRRNLKIQQLGAKEYRTSRTFNAAGAVITQIYPSQNAVAYNYDNGGRLGDKDVNNLAFTGNLGDGVQRTYAKAITYDPAGLKQEQFGTNTAVFNKRVYNSRLQLAEILLSTTGNDTTWDRGKIINDYSAQCSGASCNGTDNNGNLVRQQHLIPGAATQRQQQYQYDTLNRLQWVLETNGGVNQWRQWFKYDRWGNRTIDTTMEGSDPRTFGGVNNLGFEVEHLTNRLLAPGDLPLSPNNRKMRYDAAGNLVNDSWTSFGSMSPGEFTRKYDGENRMVSAKDDTAGTSTYSYSSSGARVRRKKGTVETWHVYGFDGELLAEYAADGVAANPQREYGYKNGKLLVTTENASLGAAAPSSLTATPPTSGSSVTLSWSPASGATNYRVERKPATGSFTLAGTTSSTSLVDTGTSSGNAYLFRVCAADGAGQCISAFSNLALGAAITFATDPTIVSIADDPSGVTVTSLKAAHINELRAAVTAVRQLAGLTGPTWTYPNITVNNEIHVEDVRDLRTQLDEALTAMGIQTTAYTDPILKGFVEDPVNATLIKAVHIRQLRDRVRSGTGGAGGGGGTSFKIYWLVTDHLGTPRMSVDLTGTLANMKRHDYLPFGEELFAGTGGRSTGQGYGCPPGQSSCNGDNVRQQFTSQERDIETGLDYFSARYYSSLQGRFISADPYNIVLEIQTAADISEEKATTKKNAYLSKPQQWNRYAHAINNPLKYTDPTGEEIWIVGDANTQAIILARLRAMLGDLFKYLKFECKDTHIGKVLVVSYDPKMNGDAMARLGGEFGVRMAQIFESKRVVEFRIAQGFKDKNGNIYWTKAYGGSATLAATLSETGNTQIFVHPDAPKIAEQGVNSDKRQMSNDGKHLTFNQPIVDAHEFGHAYADIIDNSMNPENSEMRSLQFERLMRARQQLPNWRIIH